ncbi:MAG: lactate utilization protein [Deltaproteobacteria bacterium]|nr:lactate utilization protein [Deltaproteobacteria bacterium]
MSIEIKKCLTSLRSRHINGIFAETSGDAASKAIKLIPPGSVVGLGDSSTVRGIGLLEMLEKRSNSVLNPFKSQPPGMAPEKASEYTDKLSRQATLCDIFLTGTNAVTQDGRLVNVDAVGNRVAGMFWGHPVSIIIVGRNKIVRDLDEAFDRIRNVIAPNHTFIKMAGFNGKDQKKPCVTTGRCGDCRSPDRACNIFTIIESKPLRTVLNVIIVDEDLGLGWDPAWPEARIKQIIENHKKFVWKARFDVFK